MLRKKLLYGVVCLSPQENLLEAETMKVHYDAEPDIAYIRFSGKKPNGAIEIDEGVVLDTTADNEIVGLEIFDAHKRMPVNSLFRLEIVNSSR
jgi:uncharacterized protein YuzE